MSNSPHIVDITLENAQQYLIDESFQRPVLVDFWADWCGPCKNLMPILEKLAAEYDGALLLAKVNADELNMLAAQFGVRSLPTVVLMKAGQPVDGFTGLKPEAELRKLLDQHLPKAWERKWQEALKAMAEDQFDRALPILREAYAESNQQGRVALSYAEALIQCQRLNDAEAVLDKVKLVDRDPLFDQLKASLDLARNAKKAPEISALEEQLASDPGNAELSFALALQYSQHNFPGEALALLFQLLQKNLNARDGEVKKTFIDILAVLGKGDPLAAEYQRKLYTLLY